MNAKFINETTGMEKVIELKPGEENKRVFLIDGKKWKKVPKPKYKSRAARLSESWRKYC